MAASISVRRFPSFNDRASRSEKMKITKLGPKIQKKARSLGASYAYVCKNKTGNYYPTTVAFFAEGGKFIARRTLNTVAN